MAIQNADFEWVAVSTLLHVFFFSFKGNAVPSAFLFFNRHGEYSSISLVPSSSELMSLEVLVAM